MIWLIILAVVWTVGAVWLVHAALNAPTYPADCSRLDAADQYEDRR